MRYRAFFDRCPAWRVGGPSGLLFEALGPLPFLVGLSAYPLDAPGLMNYLAGTELTFGFIGAA